MVQRSLSIKRMALPILSVWSVAAKEIPFRAAQPGPIRSGNGLCIDIYDPINDIPTSGNPAYLFRCDGTDTQKWVRPGLSDNRLQLINTNLCLDLSEGNVNTNNDFVLLQLCDNTKTSQQWVYDGFHIHLQYNDGLCLIIGNMADRGSSVVVGPCTDQVDNTWVEYSTKFLSSFTSFNFKHLLCPVNSKVIHIGGRGGLWVDQITMTCSDGTILGPVGGNGGSPVTTSDCLNGYTAVYVTYGTLIGKVTAYCQGITLPTTDIGIGVNEGSGSTSLITLRSDEQLVGMQIYSKSSYVDQFGLLYSDRWVASHSPTPHPTAVPTFTPTSHPTSKPSRFPSMKSTVQPSRIPSSRQSIRPTIHPTVIPPNIKDHGHDMHSFLYGILAFSIPATITISIIMYRRRQRHKQEFRNLDRILPLK
jgi:hypothetical protein